MTDKDKINKLYSDIKNIDIPDDLVDSDLQEMVTDIGEGLNIILEAIKLIGLKYKKWIMTELLSVSFEKKPINTIKL